MANPSPLIDLADALSALRAARQTVLQEISAPRPTPEQLLKPLVELVAALGKPRAARPVQCPEEYLRQWQELLAGRRPRLEPRATRYLCWHADVATTPQFQNYLDREEVELRGRNLQGLVHCCHMKWSSTFRTNQAAIRVRNRLAKYTGPSRLLRKWKDAGALIIGARGDEDFARVLLRASTDVKPACASWGVEENSAYVCEAVRHAGEKCIGEMDRVPAIRDYLFRVLLPWPHWRLEAFRALVHTLILSPSVVRGPKTLQDAIVEFVLGDGRLGDPRLPANRVKWAGLNDASSQVIEWLSLGDITFFFEHVLPRRADPQGRKEFWLRYVSKLKMSRPLLFWSDEARLAAVVREAKGKIRHGKIGGATSAFVLDFGPLVAVEFSKVGNACYIYKKSAIAKVIPDFWVSHISHEGRLKDMQLCERRVVHRHGWQDEVRSLLATYGIRSI